MHLFVDNLDRGFTDGTVKWSDTTKEAFSKAREAFKSPVGSAGIARTLHFVLSLHPDYTKPIDVPPIPADPSLKNFFSQYDNAIQETIKNAKQTVKILGGKR